MNKLKIGDLLWKYSSPYIMKYKVIALRVYETSTLYEIECLSCTHGSRCKVLIGGKLNELCFIEMASNDEDQSYWHRTKCTFDGYYRITENEAHLDRQIYIKHLCNEDVKKAEERLKDAIEKKKVADELLQSLKLKVQND
jgi:hypothetical protein